MNSVRLRGENRFLKILLVTLVIVGLYGLYFLPHQFVHAIENEDFTVNYYDFWNNKIKSEQVHYGNPANPPHAGSVPAPEGQVFTGWSSGALNRVTDNLEVWAMYEQVVIPPSGIESNPPDEEPGTAAPSNTAADPEPVEVEEEKETEGVDEEEDIEDAVKTETEESGEGAEVPAPGEIRYTVTFKSGEGSSAGDKILFVYEDGVLLKDLDLPEPPVPSDPIFKFEGWKPAWGDETLVAGDMVFTAQWSQGVPGGAASKRDWGKVLGNPNFKHPVNGSVFSLPGNAHKLEFNGVSSNGKTYIDYIYLVIDDEGNATLYFLVSAGDKKFLDGNGVSSLTFSGYQGTLAGRWLDGDPKSPNTIDYGAYRVYIPASDIEKLASGVVVVSMEGSPGQSIGINQAAKLTFTNIFMTEHWIYDNDPSGASLKVVVPRVANAGQTVTALAISIRGFEYDDDCEANVKFGIMSADSSGTNPTLKLYYKRSAEALEIIITGKSGSTPYNGGSQSLSGVRTSPLYRITIPSAGPGDEYLIIGIVTGDDPSGVDTGKYPQNLALEPGYQIVYKGPKMTAGLKTEFEDLTALFGAPAIVNGALVITGFENLVTITAGSAEREYNGLPLTEDSVTISGLPEGYTAEAVNFGSITIPGSAANQVDMGSIIIRDANGRDATKSFTNIQTLDGTLTVTANKSPVVIAAGSASKEYDGTPLSQPAYTFEGLPDGFVLTAKTAGTIINPGSKDNVIESYRIYYDGADVTEYFDKDCITTMNGTLAIAAYTKKITVTAAGEEREYNGKPLVNAGYTEAGLPPGHYLAAIVTGSITEAGSVPNVVAGYTIIRNSDGEDVTEYFKETVTLVDGTLTVTPYTGGIVINSGSNSKEYDGTPLTEGSYTVTGLTGPFSGYRLEAVITGAITNVGSTDNTIADGYVIYDLDGVEVTGSFYNVVKNPGKLTITENRSEVLIWSGSGSRPYDGNPLTNGEYGWEGLPDGLTVEAIVTGSITDPGSADNTISSYIIKDSAGNDVTVHFKNIIERTGTLTVTGFEGVITVTAASAEREYNGLPLTDGSFIVTGLPEGYVLKTAVTGTITDPGSAPNTAGSYLITRESDSKDVTGFFTVVKENGALTVTPYEAEISIIAASDSKVFDGKPLIRDSLAGPNGVTGLPERHELRDAAVEGSVTYPGPAADNVIAGYRIVRLIDEVDVTEMLKGNVRTVNGELTVTNAPGPKVSGGDNEKEYDGTPLYPKEFDIEFDAAGRLPDGFTIEITTKTEARDLTGEGGEPIVIEAIVIRDPAGNDMTKYFDMPDPEPGVLVVTSNTAPILVIAGSNSKVYDGTELVDPSYKAEGLLKGHTLIAATSGSITDSGKEDNVIDRESIVIIRNSDGKTVTGYFSNIIIKNGELIVSPGIIRIVAVSDTKVYDNRPLKNGDYILEGTLGAGDALVNVMVEGSQTDVGECGNIVSEAVIMTGEYGKTGNYNIEYADGVLTVDPALLVITVLDQTVEEGDPVPSAYDLKMEVFLGGDNYFVLEGIGEYRTGYTPAAKAGEEFPVEVSGWTARNYEIQYIPGKIYVKGRSGDEGGETSDEGGGGESGESGDGGDSGGGRENGGSAGQPAGPQSVTTTINGEETVLAGTVIPIDDMGVPYAGYSAWALANLILTIISCLIALLLVVIYFLKLRKEGVYEENNTDARVTRYITGAALEEAQEDEVDREEKMDGRLPLRLIAVVAAIVAVIMFLSTEDMTLPIVFLDKWTVWHLVITTAGICLGIFSREKYENAEEKEEGPYGGEQA